MVTVRVVLALAASQNWCLHQMNAYRMEICLKRCVCKSHRDFPVGGEPNMQAKKSLYRLKQSSRKRNLKLTEALLDSGFTQINYDYSLFTKRLDTRMVVILVYVDDLLIT